MKRYQHLLSPVRIGNSVLKNRLVYPNASPHFFQGPETYPAEPYRAFNSSLAKNGAAIVTLAEWADVGRRDKFPANMDMPHMQAFDLSDPSVHNYISQLADEIHFFGSKVLLNSELRLPQGYSLNGGPGAGPMRGKMTAAIPREMIPEVIDAYVKKVRLYRNLGYDGVTMRIDGSMLPSDDPRQDEYGGCLENRMRMVLELYSRIKKEFGPSFITEVQLAGEQPHGYTGAHKHGYTIQDTVEFARLAKGLVDIIQLRESDMCKSHPTGFTFKKGEHATIGYSEAIKAAGVRILTEPLGGFQDPAELEGYIRDGRCDLIGAARAFMCDPEYGRKLYEGKGEEITPCLWCNKCHGTILPEPDPWISCCSVNPKLGLQDKLHRLENNNVTPKKVAVIGGGPSGMRAAVFAAEKGHLVTLFEKSDYLGGQLLHAESFSFKWPIRDFRNWLVREMDRLGVTVVMNTAPTADDISAAGFDAVIAATGASPVLPRSIKGLRDDSGKALYPTCVDVFGKEAELGHKVIMVGGSETGIETAMYLAENGHDVTVLTRQSEIGHDCSKLHYITMAWVKIGPDGTGHMAPAWEKYDNIHGIPSVTTLEVDGGRVTYRDFGGNISTVEGDSVVICGGMSPNVDAALSYADAADSFVLIGDCNSKGNIQRCMRDAFAAVQRI